MSDVPTQFADRLRAWLDVEGPEQALILMRAESELLQRLPRVDDKPHPLVGLAVALMTGALNRCGRAKAVPVFLTRMADLVAPTHRYYVRATAGDDLMGFFPYLWNQAIVASIAVGDHEDSVAAILQAAGWLRYPEGRQLPNDPTVSGLLSHPAAAAYGPFCLERGWLLERQAEVSDGQ